VALVIVVLTAAACCDKLSLIVISSKLLVAGCVGTWSSQLVVMYISSWSFVFGVA